MLPLQGQLYEYIGAAQRLWARKDAWMPQADEHTNTLLLQAGTACSKQCSSLASATQSDTNNSNLVL